MGVRVRLSFSCMEKKLSVLYNCKIEGNTLLKVKSQLPVLLKGIRSLFYMNENALPRALTTGDHYPFIPGIKGDKRRTLRGEITDHYIRSTGFVLEDRLLVSLQNNSLKDTGSSN